MNRLAKTFFIAASSVALAAPAFAPAFAMDLPGDFAALDGNADARIEFNEFASYAKNQGVTQTLAAQHFTKMSAGDAVITEDEFFLASATGSHALTPAPAYAPDYADAFSAPLTEVAPASAMVAEPVQPEAVMASVEDATPPAGDETTYDQELSYEVETETSVDGDTVDVTTEITPVETPVETIDTAPTEPLPEGTVLSTTPVEGVAGEVEMFEGPDAETDVDVDADADAMLEEGEMDAADTMTDEEDPLN